MGAVASIEQEFTTTARIVAIAQQKPGRKTVGVKVATDEGDEIWVNVYADKAAELGKGERYEFKYKGDGKYVTSYKHITPHGHQAQQEPQPQQGNGKKMDYWSPKPRDPQERMEIWVNSMLGREIEMGRGFMSEDQLVARAQVHKSVYGRVFGDQQQTAD
jgi:hypothetical protein